VAAIAVPAFRKTGGFVKGNRGLRLNTIVLAATVLLSVGAFAESNKGSMFLGQTTNVAGKQLASGNYKVQWEGSGDQVELKIYLGKNTVASLPARVVKVDHAYGSDSSLVNKNDDGSFSLSEIRFGGKKFALQVGGEGGGAAGAAGAAK
jgi:hypothetical protein